MPGTPISPLTPLRQIDADALRQMAREIEGQRTILPSGVPFVRSESGGASFTPAATVSIGDGTTTTAGIDTLVFTGSVTVSTSDDSPGSATVQVGGGSFSGSRVTRNGLGDHTISASSFYQPTWADPQDSGAVAALEWDTDSFWSSGDPTSLTPAETGVYYLITVNLDLYIPISEPSGEFCSVILYHGGQVIANAIQPLYAGAEGYISLQTTFKAVNSDACYIDIHAGGAAVVVRGSTGSSFKGESFSMVKIG